MERGIDDVEPEMGELLTTNCAPTMNREKSRFNKSDTLWYQVDGRGTKA